MKKSSRHSYVAFDWLRTCPKIIKKSLQNKKQVCKTVKQVCKKIKQVCKKANKSAKECIKFKSAKKELIEDIFFN